MAERAILKYMIGMLNGKAKDLGKGNVIIETSGGVGYVINVSESVKNTILSQKECTLYTHTAMRKDTIELFGFLENEEYSTFLLLITVNGIGPKKAITILETVPSSSLLSAISKEDSDTLVSYGINKKQAVKIILDLSKKINLQKDDQSSDTIIALIALGYDKREAVEAIKNIDKTGPIEEQIQLALRSMRRGVQDK